MKNKILAMLAISSVCILGACSDESEPSISDKCSKGLSEGCLVGTWNLLSMGNKADSTSIFIDYSAAPGKLVINKDKSFQYTTSNAPTSEMATTGGCGGVEGNYGTWEIDEAAGTLTFKFTIGDCYDAGSKVTVTPTIDALELNLNGIAFQKGDAGDSNILSYGTEIFTRQ